MKNFFIIILLVTIIFGVLACESDDYEKITAKEGREMIANVDVIIVDVREQSEYDAGHIAQAILLPLGKITSEAENMLTDKKATIIVYCRSGRRSADAAKMLVSLGYKNIYDMGGILDWTNEGYEVVN